MNTFLQSMPMGIVTARLSVTEVAQIYGCSVPTVWRWTKRGEIPSCRKIGGKSSWLASEILEHAHRPSSEPSQEVAA